MTSRQQADERQTIRNEGNPHKYFHQMLNMADDDLNAPQYRLLGHYLRWAGHGGSREEGIRETARITHLGKETVRKVRQELVDLGYLRITEPTKDEQKEGRATIITVLDRWAENINRYAGGGVPNQVQGYTQSGTPPVPNQTHPPVPNEVHLEEQLEEHQEHSKKKATAPSTAIDTKPPLSSLRSELPIQCIPEGESPMGETQQQHLEAFADFVETLPIEDDDGMISGDEYERLYPDADKPKLYPCTAKDIAEMIAAWWEWVPVRPAVRGRATTLSTQISIPTNREYAQALFERGVRPVDFVRTLFPFRKRMVAGEVIKPMPFQYVCPMVEELVAATWLDELTSYSKDDPRYAPKKPGGRGVTFGEDLWQRDDLFVDVPPRYIRLQELEADEPEEVWVSTPSEFESWTEEDWAKDGNPL